MIHLFVLRWVSVRSTSMYSTLVPEHLLGVERWPLWTGLQKNDIIVFRDPVQDDRPRRQRQLLVKRITGIPGDEVEIRAGVLYVNGVEVPPAPGQTSSWSIRLKNGADASELLLELGLPADYVMPGHTVIDLPLNDSLAARSKKHPEVISAEPRSPSTGSRANLFPFGPNFRWNNDNYGPLRVPGVGDTVAITPFSYRSSIVLSAVMSTMLWRSLRVRCRSWKPADHYASSRTTTSCWATAGPQPDSRYWFRSCDPRGPCRFHPLNARSWGHP